MTRYIALLRGINLGQRTIPMTELRDVVVAAGGDDVKTYIQSGNVVFTHAARSAPKLAGDLRQRIEAAAGFDVPLVLRTERQLAAVVDANPFPSDEPKQLHVLFLAGTPAKGALDPIDLAAFAPERLALVGSEIYYHLPDGLGRAKLPMAVAKLRDPAIKTATARNWRTVTILLDMARA